MLSVMSESADEVLPVSDLEPPASSSSAVRVVGIAVVVVLIAAVASALLLRADERSPEERFAAVPAAVAEEPFAFEVTLGGAMPGLGQDVELTMVGAADPVAKRLKADLDLSAVLPAGMPGAPTTISFVGEGSVLYVQTPVGLGGAVRWAKIDAGELSGATGGLPSGTNPLDSFDQLQAVGREIEDLGEEEVRGTTTTRFRTALDPAKILAQLPEERRAAAEATLGQMSEIPVEVWLDDEDRPRRQRMQFALPDGGSMSITIEAFDFGKPVVIELPPADQVVEGGGLFGTPSS